MKQTKWLFFFGCLALLVGSIVGAVVTLEKQRQQTRGWRDATTTLDLPTRLPVAGVNVDLRQYTPDELDTNLDRIAAAGFTWVRQPFLWQDIESEPGVYAWDVYDALVAAVETHPSLQLVAVLDGTPPWARHKLAPEHPFAPPDSVSAYGQFAGAVAARYGDSLTMYQVWDEPNLKSHWGNMDPRPAHYVAMLREAYTAIHAADGEATVIAAALAPTVETGPDNLSDLLFLQAIYDQGGGDYFDAAAAKPYGYNTGPEDRQVDYGTLNFSRLILLREEMERRGDGHKALWGSNFGWNTLPADWSGPPSIWGSVSAEQQMYYTQDAYRRAIREWPWIGGLIVQHWDPDAPADDPIQGFALAGVIDSWGDVSAWFAAEGLLPGLHPVQNLFTTYSEHWRFSELGVDAEIPDPDAVSPGDENRITVRFEGTAFAIPTRRDDYLGYLYILVDGKPANALPRNRDGETFVILTSPERTPTLDLITVAEGLPDGLHTVEIVHRPINGDDRWPIAGYAVGTPPDTDRYTRALTVCAVVAGLSLLGAGVLALRLPWRHLRPPSPDTLRRLGEWIVGLAVSGLVFLGTVLTWGDTIPTVLRRDPPALAITIITAGVAALSPVFVITLLALGVLFVLIYNRPLLGVLLIMFWSAFFLSTLDLLIRTFATVEVILVLTILAVMARALVEWARRRKAGVAGLPDMSQRHILAADWLALAWVVLGIVSLTWADLLSMATHELRVIILGPAAFYALLRLMSLDRRDLLWLADGLLIIGTIIAVAGLFLYITGQHVVEAEEGTHRLVGVYGSPNGVGLYLGRCLPFALAYALLLPGTWRRSIGVVTGGIMLVAVLLSQSRGAILLGLPAAFATVLLLWRGRRALVPLAIAAVVGLVGLALLSQVLPRLPDIGGSTAFFRTRLWYSSLNLIRERPLTGAGLDQFLYLYRSRYLLPEAWEEPNLSIPHDILLNHWVNLGILGVVMGLGFQVLFWRSLLRTYRHVPASDPEFAALLLGLGGSMADFLAHGLVDVSYFAINLAFVFFLSLALLNRLALRVGALPERSPRHVVVPAAAVQDQSEPEPVT